MKKITIDDITSSLHKLQADMLQLSRKESSLYAQLDSVADTDISTAQKVKTCKNRVLNLIDEIPFDELKRLKKQATLLKCEIRYYSKLKTTKHQPTKELIACDSIVSDVKSRIQTAIRRRDDLENFDQLLTFVGKGYKMADFKKNGNNPYEALK